MSLKNIQDCFRIDELDREAVFEPQVNVSPGDQVPIVVNAESSGSGMKTSLQLFNFGLMPYGYKQEERIINAHSKGINHNRLFRKAIRKQRCLIPANGFIQWEPTGTSIPYFVYQKKAQQPFMMAGVWEEQEDRKTGELQRNFSILVTSANGLLQKTGQQYSPVIFTRINEKNWLRNDLALSDITAMLQPFDAAGFNAYPIISTIKSTCKNDTSLLEISGKPIEPEVQYDFSKKLELHGMGETAARRRRRKEEMDLPKG